MLCLDDMSSTLKPRSPPCGGAATPPPKTGLHPASGGARPTPTAASDQPAALDFQGCPVDATHSDMSAMADRFAKTGAPAGPEECGPPWAILDQPDGLYPARPQGGPPVAFALLKGDFTAPRELQFALLADAGTAVDLAVPRIPGGGSDAADPAFVAHRCPFGCGRLVVVVRAGLNGRCGYCSHSAQEHPEHLRSARQWFLF